MRRDIQEALQSVGEVAVFAWSLLELLLTRILPLAGFVAGHLLLQFGRLLAAVVIPAAGRRRERRAAYSSDVQAEEVIEEDNVLLQKDGGDENDLESLKGNLEERQPSFGAGDAVPKIHVAESLPSDEQVTDLGESSSPANQVQQRGSDVAESANEVNVAEADIPANDVEVRGNVDGHVAETEPLNVDVAGGEQGQVSAKGEGSAGKMDLEPSDVRRRRMRVLPPSLSQIKRTLMQRSRRGAWASPRSMMTPSPIHKKKPNRKLTIKSSSSPDNFMGKFRKHFLLDSA